MATFGQEYVATGGDGHEHTRAVDMLDRLWREFDILEMDGVLMHRAGQIAYQQSLRGYDATQCAAAERLAADDLVFASGDRKLLAACHDLGLATADVNP